MPVYKTMTHQQVGVKSSVRNNQYALIHRNRTIWRNSLPDTASVGKHLTVCV